MPFPEHHPLIVAICVVAFGCLMISLPMVDDHAVLAIAGGTCLLGLLVVLYIVLL